jgi:hypothetical protein
MSVYCPDNHFIQQVRDAGADAFLPLPAEAHAIQEPSPPPLTTLSGGRVPALHRLTALPCHRACRTSARIFRTTWRSNVVCASPSSAAASSEVSAPAAESSVTDNLLSVNSFQMALTMG